MHLMWAEMGVECLGNGGISVDCRHVASHDLAAQGIVGRRIRRGRPIMKEENVGEKPDELEQGISGYGT